MEFVALAQECAPEISPRTLAAVARVESSLNPYAIGVVNGALKRQPRNLIEAVATAKQLESEGWNFSVGIVQVNRYNLPKYGLSYEQAFNACANVAAGGRILSDCYSRALKPFPDPQQALRAAFSCYYSGNFKRGFIPDKPGEPSYVNKVVGHAKSLDLAVMKVLPPVFKDETGGAPIAVVRLASSTKRSPAGSAIPKPSPATAEPLALFAMPAEGANSLLF